MMQLARAFLACSANAAASTPGTRPTVTNAILAMVGFPSIWRSVTSASVWTDSGVLPAWASMLESAIVKHAAWAAPISCSGFAPGPSSKRLLKV